jgi:chromate transporter
LTAISAAVVGVILSLAVFFADHVFHLSEPMALWDKTALLIAVAAAIALLRFKWGTIRLIAVCALAGLVVSYVPWW